MHFSAAEITAFVGSLIWPLFRVSAVMMTAPLIGSQNVPAPVRLAIALVLTLILLPSLPPMPAVDAFSLSSVMITINQILIGVVIGFSLQLVFNAIITGGQIIAMQMGLGFASMVDPQNGQQVPVIGQFYLMMASLLFLAMNGHLVLIELLADSFRVLPIGDGGFDAGAMRAMAWWGTEMFAGAVWMALPAVAALLLVNAAFGVMSRASPQLNIFAIGFPITLLMGFVVMLFVMPAFLPQFTSITDSMFQLVRALLGGAG